MMTVLDLDTTTAAYRLTIAKAIVEQVAPSGKDKVDICRRLGLMITSMTASTTAQACRRCEGLFKLNAREILFFTARRLDFPAHCPACRRERRRERETVRGARGAC